MAASIAIANSVSLVEKAFIGRILFGCSNISIQKRLIATTNVLKLKEIHQKKEKNVTVIEGKDVESPRKNQLLQIQSPHKEACPLCRLNMEIKYTDVLILNQFIDPNLKIYSKQVSGLCQEKYRLAVSLIWKARAAGLLPDPTQPFGKTKWKRYHCYFEED